MTATELSILLGLFAIALSVWFFIATTRTHNQTLRISAEISGLVDTVKSIANQISNEVARLGTSHLGLIRESWQHIAQTDSAKDMARRAEDRASAEISGLREEFRTEIGALVDKVTEQHLEVETIRGELQTLFDRAITVTREVENRVRTRTVKESLRGHILQVLRGSGVADGVLANEIVEGQLSFDPVSVVTELRDMRAEGLITWDGKELSPDSRVRMNEEEEDTESGAP